MNAASKALAVLLVALASPLAARAQMMGDGHRGVCSDCHVGAANNRYELNTEDSMLVFEVDAYGFSKTIGTFDEIVGGFVFDPASPETSSIVVSIDSSSLETSNSALNSLVLSERFLDVENHPLMTFQSSAVAAIDGTHLKVDGRVAIRGVERPLSLDVTINKLGVHPVTGQSTSGVVVTGRVHRSDFGIDLGLPEIGDDIVFTVYAQGNLLD